MKNSRIAAQAVSFAMTSIVSISCIQSIAQDSAAVLPAYQSPSADSATLVEAPNAPKLQGATCGTIGPQGLDTQSVTDSTVAESEAPLATTFDANALLRGLDLGQLKGKLTETAFAFIESLQKAGQNKQSNYAVPGGYTVIQRTVSPVSPMVLK